MNATATLAPASESTAERVLYLSHSSSTKYEVCPHQYKIHYKERLSSLESSINLVYGGAYDEAVSTFLVAHALGHTDEVDPVKLFEEYFNEHVEGQAIAYSSTLNTREICLDSGKLLVDSFMESWVRLGYQVMLDTEGRPVVQRELKVRLPHNVIYTSILDVLMMTPEEQVVIADVKTAAQASDEVFYHTTGQLTGQQLVVEAHKDELGIDGVDGLTFYISLKKKKPTKKTSKGPQVLDPWIVRPRTQDELDAYVQSRLWVAEDIRHGRFPKRSLDAYNTPCKLCEYANYCLYTDRSGLKERERRKR